MAEDRIDRDRYWSGLSKAAKEYYKQCGHPNPDGLQDYLKEYYGILMVLTTGQMITGDYSVIDEKKYLIFLLKFMT
jgi:hypothetical protein